jgi:hypothetical protein
MFSSPTDEKGYHDAFVTNDIITALYRDFIANGRQSESIEYCKTRTGESNKYFLHFNRLITLMSF